MNFSGYQHEARRTLTMPADPSPLLLAVIGLGLAGEAGEVVELIKKHVGHGRDLDAREVKKELGDVLRYLADVASLLGLNSLEIRVHPVVAPRSAWYVYPNMLLVRSWAEFLAGLRGATWHDDMWNCPTWTSEDPTDAAACRCTSEGWLSPDDPRPDTGDSLDGTTPAPGGLPEPE